MVSTMGLAGKLEAIWASRSALESGASPEGGWIPIMRTRDNDTIPDPRPAEEPSQASTDPMGDAASTSRQNNSEPEPMDVILRKVVQATPDVPNSLEPGIAYQATHAPIPAYGGRELEPRVVVHRTTDPGRANPYAASEGGSRSRIDVETVEIPRAPRFNPNWIAVGVFVGVVAIGALALIALVVRHTSSDGERSVASPSASIMAAPPQPLPVQTSALTAAPSSLEAALPPTATVTASVVASTPRGGRAVPVLQPVTNAPRPKPAPAGTDAPPSPLINQAPL
jgi:hypothetical protein